jgi:hypothetical protein
MNVFLFIILAILLILLLAIGIVMIVMRNKYVNPTALLIVGILLVVIAGIGLLLILWAFFKPTRPRTQTKVVRVVSQTSPRVEPHITPQILECSSTETGLLPELVQPINFM